MNVAFLGLGIMGSRMAANVVRAGHTVTAWTHTPGKAERWAEQHGAAWAQSPADAAATADLVISMVVDGEMVTALLTAAADGARPDALFVDMSTIAPDQSRAIAATLSARGIAFMDAPVTGSSPRAEDGTLTIMAGGDPADFERAREVFDAMGTTILHVGEVGQGETIKLINNAVAAANAAALAQALVLGDAAGVDLDALSAVIDSGSAASAMAGLKTGPMRAHDFAPLFKAEHMLKDVLLCLTEAERVGVPFPAAEDARHALDGAVAEGHGPEDVAALLIHYERLADHRIGG